MATVILFSKLNVMDVCLSDTHLVLHKVQVRSIRSTYIPLLPFKWPLTWRILWRNTKGWGKVGKGILLDQWNAALVCFPLTARWLFCISMCVNVLLRCPSHRPPCPHLCSGPHCLSSVPHHFYCSSLAYSCAMLGPSAASHTPVHLQLISIKILVIPSGLGVRSWVHLIPKPSQNNLAYTWTQQTLTHSVKLSHLMEP